jgi:hypothetical protein
MDRSSADTVLQIGPPVWQTSLVNSNL